MDCSSQAAAKTQTAEEIAGRCWFFHKWTLWAIHQSSVKANVAGQLVDGVAEYQSRRCLRCGVTQKKSVGEYI